jgi:hypothetical protein
VFEGRRHGVDPDDERRHPPGEEALWQESYYLDFVADDDSVGGYVRLGMYPNLGVSWWTTFVVGPDRPTVASVAFDLAVPETGLALRDPGFDVAGTVDDPLGRFGVRGRAPAAIHADPAALYSTEPGEATTLDLDLEWRTDGSAFHYELTTRYEIPCTVAGEVTIGDERLTVAGSGQRDHSWGVRDWWAFGWCWAAVRLDDGTRVHLADIRMPGFPVAFGYVQDARGTEPVAKIVMDEELADYGFPRRANISLEPSGINLAVEPLAFGPLLLVAGDGRTSRFPRAMARFSTDDGRRGTGWIEFNQPSA